MGIKAWIKQRIEDYARERRIETLQHNAKWAEENSAKYFSDLLYRDMLKEIGQRSEAQRKRMAKNHG